MRVKPVTCVAAATFDCEKIGRITRSRVLLLPLPASPIRNRCGNLMPERRRWGLIRGKAEHIASAFPRELSRVKNTKESA